MVEFVIVYTLRDRWGKEIPSHSTIDGGYISYTNLLKEEKDLIYVPSDSGYYWDEHLHRIGHDE